MTRNVARPEDVFDLLCLNDNAPSWIAKRRQAEQEIIQTGREPRIEDIYALIAPDGREAQIWMQAEIDLETRLLRARPAGKALFAQRMGLDHQGVFVTSDTPHSATSIQSFFRGAIDDVNAEILTSADQGCSKHKGTLFERLIEKSGNKPESIEHIGDNPRVDIAGGDKFGLKTTLLDAPLDNYLGHEQHARIFRPRASKLTPAESVAIGVIKNRFFDTPQRSPFAGSLVQFGYMAYGPLFLSIAIWLINQVRLKGEKSVFCLSRDGYIIDHFVNRISGQYALPETSTYVYASRQVSKMLDVQCTNSLQAALEATKGTPRQRLKAVLGRSEIGEEKDWDNISGLIADIGPEILQYTHGQKTRYRDYLIREGLGEGAVIFDIGYQGTTQKALQDLMGVDLYGTYVVTFPELHHTVENHATSTARFIDPKSDREQNRKFIKYRLMHEVIFSAPDGSFCGFGPDGEPLFASENENTALTALHKGASMFLDDFLSAWPYDETKISLSPDFAFAHVHQHFASPSHIDDVRMMSHLVFDNAFEGYDQKPMVSEYPHQGSVSGLWREGAKVLRGQPTENLQIRLLKKLLGQMIVSIFVKMVRSESKKRKLRNDPLMFFSDTKSRWLQRLAFLYY